MTRRVEQLYSVQVRLTPEERRVLTALATLRNLSEEQLLRDELGFGALPHETPPGAREDVGPPDGRAPSFALSRQSRPR